MKIPTELRSRLQVERGVSVTEACDRCGQLLGPVRYTGIRESGVWCSRTCRDGSSAVAPGTCCGCRASLAGLRRGTKFCSDVCRVRENRKSQTTQNSRNGRNETKDLFGGLKVLAMDTPEACKTTYTAICKL